ncbi:MAG: Na/Pi cotransporter family protein [Flavobacteriales bacterium]|jgi:phosphate:Na+ symporter|nr:Na/Pi cotransporter family protein [Flavobacteriales bacterium]MDG1798979.1 Na/Pi cotransporter family protein [Flavobacteriales bacterium]
MTFFDFLIIIGALGFFIYGMKVMSDGIQKVAGSKMRNILSSMTSNRFLGITTGFLITALLQSSSATTVMTVSFVNAGLLSLVESIGVIMGANIGTTITAWLISILGFKVKISTIALPIIAIGFPLMFSKKTNLKAWAEVLIGFALLFMGLDELKHAVPDLKQNPSFLSFLADYADQGYISTIIFIGVGTILTLVVQSSSAAMALTLVMCFEGYIPFELAAAMVLGENIGTTITANLAALVANVHAKRAARAHFIFNVFGVVWMIIAFPFFINFIDQYMTEYMGMSPLNPVDKSATVPLGLSIFHTTFNIFNVVLLVGFVPFMSKIATSLVKSKGDADEEFKLDYISAAGIAIPEVAILEAKKEVAKFGDVTMRMNDFMKSLINDQNKKTRNKMFNKLKKYEEITDRVEVEIASYLDNLSTKEVSQNTSSQIRAMLSITNDLERIGDIYYQMSKTIERKDESKLYFLPEQRENLNNMLDVLDKAFTEMNANLRSEYGHISIENAKKHEREINQIRNNLRKSYLEQAEKGEYKFQPGIMYNDLFSSCEKVGDHIINVSEAVAGEI